MTSSTPSLPNAFSEQRSCSSSLSSCLLTWPSGMMRSGRSPSIDAGLPLNTGGDRLSDGALPERASRLGDDDRRSEVDNEFITATVSILSSSIRMV